MFVLLKILEELIDAIQFVAIPIPEQILLLFGELVIRSMDGEIILYGVLDKIVQTCLQRITTPTENCTRINREESVGDYQVFINPDDFTITSAFRASSLRIVEVEKCRCRLLKFDSVSLESCTKVFVHKCAVLLQYRDATSIVAFAKGCFDRIATTCKEFARIRHFKPIYHEVDFLPL